MKLITFFIAILACILVSLSLVHCTEQAQDVDNSNIPILMMHGIGGSPSDFNGMRTIFAKLRPNIPTYALDVNNKSQSFGNLQNQMLDVQKKIMELQKEHGFTKFHLVCHSQGALLCRTLAAYWTGHQIQNLVLLSGPIVGQYGVPPVSFLPEALKSLTTTGAHIILYTNAAQNLFSIANMWKDPFHYDEYLNSNKFLTRLYNESRAADDIHQSFQLKENFMRVNKVYFFGSDGDEVIIPWQSAILGFWEKGSNSKMVPMEQQNFYVHDYCGFKTMHRTGRLSINVVPKVPHNDWPRNQDLIAKYIVPLF